ncbi:UDP-glucose 4-epimerase GalE [Polynucleobacter paneuropaeus]|nr:UDP-glucose 4-epimerase GalE [Polynucleobacter paneuropaeus]MBT8583034.1 UDP-glucose 4-epimerase GalE [Polynucleobacter paneuropaeus]
MNILLTGGAGYIGSHIAVSLFEQGHQVVILDNFCNSKKAVMDQIKLILGKSVPYIEMDIRETVGVVQVLKDFKINAVIHLAGFKAVGESVNQPLEYYDNNIGGSISLLTAMKATEVKSLIFSSSATVYGDPVYLPIDEDHPLAPTNPYGKTKFFIEEILKDLATSDPSWRIICLRYFNPVGNHSSGLIFENPNSMPNNLMPFINRVSNGGAPKLNIFGNDYDTVDGTGVRDYIHVMDLADGHLAALNYLNSFVGCASINLGTGKGYSVLEIVRSYEKINQVQVPCEFTSRRPGDIAICFAKVDKAKNLLGWSAKRTLSEMCLINEVQNS